MKWTVLAAAIAAALSSFSAAPVVASDLADVVRARANARAGGGTSGHDAWVLKRHGRLSGPSSRRGLAKKKAAKKRALIAAKKKKAAAAKRRALIAAKKKKAAERRAYLLAKKKKAEKKRALLAAKKKNAEREKLAAQKEAEAQKVAAIKTSETQAAGDAAAQNEKKESAFVSAPSTATLLTSHELEPKNTQTPLAPMPSNVAAVADTSQSENAQTTTTVEKAPTVGEASKGAEENCKRFLPAIGLTISVGC